MTDELLDSPKRYPRTLEQAFGPHTSREIDAERPAATWRELAREALYYLAAGALLVAMLTAPHWWPAALHP